MRNVTFELREVFFDVEIIGLDPFDCHMITIQVREGGSAAVWTYGCPRGSRAQEGGFRGMGSEPRSMRMEVTPEWTIATLWATHAVAHSLSWLERDHLAPLRPVSQVQAHTRTKAACVKDTSSWGDR